MGEKVTRVNLNKSQIVVMEIQSKRELNSTVTVKKDAGSYVEDKDADTKRSTSEASVLRLTQLTVLLLFNTGVTQAK